MVFCNFFKEEAFYDCRSLAWLAILGSDVFDDICCKIEYGMINSVIVLCNRTTIFTDICNSQLMALMKIQVQYVRIMLSLKTTHLMLSSNSLLFTRPHHHVKATSPGNIDSLFGFLVVLGTNFQRLIVIYASIDRINLDFVATCCWFRISILCILTV